MQAHNMDVTLLFWMYSYMHKVFLVSSRIGEQDEVVHFAAWVLLLQHIVKQAVVLDQEVGGSQS